MISLHDPTSATNKQKWPYAQRRGVCIRRELGAGLLLLGVLTLDGCGSSLTALNRLAAAGSIHAQAPTIAHLQIAIAAPPSKVWALLIDAPSWPKWQKSIESVTAAGPLGNGMRFSWRTGGTNVHSQVQLFEAERRLSWTGTAMTAKAVHVWELKPEAGDRTMVTMKESMDGPLMAKFYSSQELYKADNEWLAALKRLQNSSLKAVAHDIRDEQQAHQAIA